jgi:hypothetical protein
MVIIGWVWNPVNEAFENYVMLRKFFVDASQGGEKSREGSRRVDRHSLPTP